MSAQTDYDAIYERLEFVPHRAPERMSREKLADIDPGIREVVAVLNWHKIETCQSCHGGPDHAYPEPTVDFLGTMASALLALGRVVQLGFPVRELRHKWRIEEGAPVEDVWQLVFSDSIRDGIDEPTKHMAPMPGEEKTPCCGVLPWDLPADEHLTNDVTFATCRRA